MALVDLTSIETAVREGFASGALKGASLPKTGKGARFFTLDYASKCLNPKSVEHSGYMPELGVPHRYRTAVKGRGRASTDGYLSVDFRVPCRSCTACLRNRARYWRLAAEAEIKDAAAAGARTWFGTLTLSEQSHFEMMMRAERAGGPFDLLSAEEQFARRHAAVSRELTLAIKRVRKRIKVRNSFRYLLVCEKHKSGLPHYHMLIHEVSAFTPIRKSVLRDLWTWGFWKWNLVDTDTDAWSRPAYYVSKYLSKSAEARVRASILYGRWGSGANAPAGPPKRIVRQPASEAKGVADVKTRTAKGGETPEAGLTLVTEGAGAHTHQRE